MAINVPATGFGPQVTMKEYIPRVNHKLCSVFPQVFSFHNHNGSYLLPACKPWVKYSFVWIQPGYDKFDLGEDKHISALSITARDIALDFAKQLPGMESEELVSRGIFVPKEIEPSPEEIAAARDRLAKWAEDTVNKADRLWSQTQRITDISDDAKLAANLLSFDREWAKTMVATDKVTCPACGEPMNKGAKIHSVGLKGCGMRISYDADGNPVWNEGKPAPVAQAK